MDDRDVREVLRDLPRYEASPGFTARVLRRSRAAPSRPRFRVLLSAGAVSAALVFGGVLHVDALRRERGLRRETRALARELEQMKQTLPSPYVDVGERDGVRYVIDLRRAPGRPGGTL